MSASIHPVFSFRLHQPIRGPISFGKYDGIHVCLTAATTNTDKVLIHSPHKRLGAANNRVAWSDSNYDVALLNFNQEITAVATGLLLAPNATNVAESDAAATPAVAAGKEVLVIGSPTHVLAYMVDDNSDLFYNELSGGVSRIVVGQFGTYREPLVILGGADSVRGFDRTGTEVFWLLVDGRVTALALIDVNRDGRTELVVGTASGRLCVYRDQRLETECAESASAVTTVVQADRGHLYAYALADGTLGVYDGAVRVWRVKSKNRVTALTSYALLSAAAQLIVGWDVGKVDVRDPETGDVLYRLPPFGGGGGAHPHACVALGQADYRGCGTADLVVCGAGGEVRGYERSKVNLCAMQQQQQRPEQRELQLLLAQKKRLSAELAHYETNVRFNKEQQRSGGGSAAEADAAAGLQSVGIIPANTRLQIAIYTNIEDMTKPRIEIKISTNKTTVIRAVLIFADGIFAAETYIAYPTERGVPQVIIPFVLPRDACYDINIKALVGHRNSQQFHVFELTRQLPKFSMYAVLEQQLEPARMFTAPVGFRVPENCVRFATAERFQRIMLWINQNFLLTADLEPNATLDMDAFRLYLCSLHDRSHILLEYRGGSELALHAESIELAGELVQSLARFLSAEHLQTVAHFPRVEAEVSELFRKIDGYRATFAALSVEMAQKKNDERALVVRIEDARLHQIEAMLGMFGDLRTLTEDLVGTHTIRQSNFAEIQRSLEAINGILKAASKLRVGAPAGRMMNDLKEAVKSKNISAINKIISTGTN